jgi:hypothetical protein
MGKKYKKMLISDEDSIVVVSEINPWGEKAN